LLTAFEADPVAGDCRRHRRCQGAHLDADLALILGQPVQLLDTHRADRQRAPWPDHDPPRLRLDAHDVQRLGHPADLDPAALADGEMDDAAVLPEHLPAQVHDIPGRDGFRSQLLDQARIIAVGDEADVLAVGLGRHLQPGFRRDAPHLVLGHRAQWEAQIIELLAGRAVEEIALVAARVGALVKLGAAMPDQPLDIMAGGEAVGAKLARERDQVGELDPLVACRARHRGPAARIFVGKAVDHAAAEAAFIIEHIMGDAEPIGDHLRVVNVLPRAACAGTPDRRAVVVQLERDADHLGTGARGERGRDRAVDAAGHGDDDARVSRGAAKIEVQLHRLTRGVAALYPNFTPRA